MSYEKNVQQKFCGKLPVDFDLGSKIANNGQFRRIQTPLKVNLRWIILVYTCFLDHRLAYYARAFVPLLMVLEKLDFEISPEPNFLLPMGRRKKTIFSKSVSQIFEILLYNCSSGRAPGLMKRFYPKPLLS